MVSLLSVISRYCNELVMDEAILMCLREIMTNPNEIRINFLGHLAQSIHFHLSTMASLQLFRHITYFMHLVVIFYSEYCEGLF